MYFLVDNFFDEDTIKLCSVGDNNLMSQKELLIKEIHELFDMPFMSLVTKANKAHIENHNENEIEACNIMSVKTGACPEDCKYCGQSGHYKAKFQKESLYELEQVIEKAKKAKESGCTRFCMGAAWRSPPKKDMPKIIEMIRAVKEIGLETCVTLGMLNTEQVKELDEAGLDFYNHNLDTSPEYYKEIITTRTYSDRLDTLANLANSKINVCCGGIIGMGEDRNDRVGLLYELYKLPKAPKSIPINLLSPVPGTPLADQKQLDNFEFIRTIAVTRILFPKSMIRLSAGRNKMTEEMQAWCFYAGANSLWFSQEKIFLTKNPEKNNDEALFDKLGLKKKVVKLKEETINA